MGGLGVLVRILAFNAVSDEFQGRIDKFWAPESTQPCLPLLRITSVVTADTSLVSLKGAHEHLSSLGVGRCWC
jgi:hypothetical protein